MRAATTRVLRDTPREALQYAASEGYAPLREWVAAEMRGHGVARRRVAGADHHRLAAGPRPRRQGADRAGSRGRGRVAHLPRRAAGVHALRARARGDRLRRRRAAARGAWRRRPRRALPLRAAELPEPERPLASARRGARRSSRSARSVGLPIVEDNPYGDLWFDAAAGAADRLALARGHDLPRQLLQGARAGPAPRLRDRAGRGHARSCCRPSRPPTCTRRASTSAWCTRSSATASCASTCRRSARATRRSATRCRRRSPRTCRRAGRAPAAGRCRAAACSSGSSCPKGVDAEALLPRAVERGVAFVPGAPFYAGAAMKNTLRLSFVTVAPEAIERGVRALAAALETRDERAPQRGPPSPSPRSTSSPSEPLLGNPLAVVHGADALDDARMQAFAQWTNLSETTFLLAAHRPGGRLPRPHLHARRRAAVRRPSDARQLPRLARARRRAEDARAGWCSSAASAWSTSAPRPGAPRSRRRRLRMRSGRAGAARAGAARRWALERSAVRRFAMARQRPALARPAAARCRRRCSR